MVRASNQFQVESVVMKENSKWFVLAYLLLLLKVSMLKEIGLKGEGIVGRDLIASGVEIPGILDEVSSFLSLLYQLSRFCIQHKILLE